MSALTRCVCTINTFIHFVYGNHDLMAQAVAVVQNGTVERTIKLPIDLLAQSVALYCPYNSMNTFSTASNGLFLRAYRVLHNVTPFVLLQQTAILFFNSPIHPFNLQISDGNLNNPLSKKFYFSCIVNHNTVRKFMVFDKFP